MSLIQEGTFADSALLCRALCDEIRYTLVCCELSQRMLAEFLHMHQGLLSRKMLQKSAWTISELHWVSLFLGVPLSMLISRAEARVHHTLTRSQTQ